MNKIKNVDGFVWLIVTSKAKEVFTSGLFEVYELHEDDTESLIGSMDELSKVLERGGEIGIEGGHLYTREKVSFIDKAKIINLEFGVEDSDFWITFGDYSVHYCEDYNEICVYLDADYTKTIYSRPIKSN